MSTSRRSCGCGGCGTPFVNLPSRYSLEDRTADKCLEQRQLVCVFGKRRRALESGARRLSGDAFVDPFARQHASAAFARCGTGAAAPRMTAARLQVPSRSTSRATATSASGQSNESFSPCRTWAMRRLGDGFGRQIALRISCGRKSFSRCRSRSGARKNPRATIGGWSPLHRSIRPSRPRRPGLWPP